jgi:hypothetical protein
MKSHTRQEIIEKSMHDPVINICLQYWMRGQETFEEALIRLVITQQEIIVEFQKMELERINNETMPNL